MRASPALAAGVHSLAKTTTVDVAVVGGGVVGLAAARELQRRDPGRSVAVLEKEPAIASSQTSHNSNVVHSGLLYKHGTLRADACVRGASHLYRFASEHAIPHRRCGKLLVASEESEIPMLHTLVERGQANGVEGLETLSQSQVERMEPAVKNRCGAVWSPNTGIIDYSAVSQALQKEILSHGGQIITGIEVLGANNLPEGGGVRISGVEPGQPGPTKEIHASGLVTCAGLYGDRVARQCGATDRSRLKPFRGRYWNVSDEAIRIRTGLSHSSAESVGQPFCNTNVYPVSAGGFVGIHLTPTVNGDIIMGPSGAPALDREGYRWKDVNLRQLYEFVVDSGMWSILRKNPSKVWQELISDISKRVFMRDVRKLVPDFRDDEALPSFTGCSGHYIDSNEGKPYEEFEFEVGQRAVYARHLPSPAATASLALAEEIADRCHFL